MLNPFKIFKRLTCLAILLFGGGTAAMVTIAVLATGGLGGRDLVSIPSQPSQQPATANIPAPPVKLNDVVHKRPILENVPLPTEVSGEASVIATNLFLAILLALLFGIVSNTLGNLIRDEEETFQHWFSIPIFHPLIRLLRWGTRRNVQRGCLTLPVIVTIFAVYGIIFAFLEKGLNLLTSEGMQLALVMAMSVGLISLAGDVAQRQVARFWRRTTRFGLYPANLLIAVSTTVFSRVLHLAPGIVFGVPGGVDIDLEEGPRFREVVLAFTTLVVMVILGGAGWAAAAAIREAGNQTMSASQADFSGPLAQLGLTIGLALFFVAVETSFFEMVPLSSTLGSDILHWNPVIWFITFVPVMFVFTHTLLNPGSDYLQAFEHTDVQVLAAMVGILTLITVVLWFYFRVLRRKPTLPPRAAYPPAYQGPPARPARPVPPPVFNPPVAPPQPRSGPPHAEPPRPQQPKGYVPPPIVISEPPPNKPDDEETLRLDRDKTRPAMRPKSDEKRRPGQ